jgi:hypothetical protein
LVLDRHHCADHRQPGALGARRTRELSRPRRTAGELISSR